MKSKYLIFLTILLGIFTSCNNEVNQNVNKKPCVKTGAYCRGAKLYTCHNNVNNEGIEELLEECDNGQICSDLECVVATCDEVINCIMGERRCNDDNSYKICGNYDSDSCLEWEIRECGENLICNNGLCVPKEENPCNLVDCLDHASCKVNSEGNADCVCDSGYELKDNSCVPICVPNCENKDCGDDGCDGSCGVCTGGTCNTTSGQCEATCTPDCSAKECGNDGCDGTCGTCGNNSICKEFSCVCTDGYHLEGDNCVEDTIDYCANISCGTEKHCDPTNGVCVDNTKMIDCINATPINGITDFEQVEITWGDGHWTIAENCPWHCKDGYERNENECLAITCEVNEHLEGNDCINNEKVVQCNSIDHGIDNAHNDIKDVTLVWTGNNWPNVPNCDWICDNEYHKYTDPNSGTSFCVSDTQNAICQANQDLPNNAIEETEETVTQTWIYDDEDSDEGYWLTPYCPWHCDSNNSCLSSDETSCIDKQEEDPCDGEDNNCDGIVDNASGSGVEASSCAIGDYCTGAINNGHRYIFCNALLKTWQDAETACANHVREGHLVSIDNQEENNFIKNHISDRYWIGYSQNENGGNALWYWSNTSTSTYTNWNEGEPNNSCLEKEWSWSKWKNVCVKWENCAETYSNGKWNDADCDDSRRFICEGLPGPN